MKKFFEEILKKVLTYYNYCSIIVVVERRQQMNGKALNIKIPEDLYNKLKEEAERKCISLAAIVRIICVDYFDKK